MNVPIARFNVEDQSEFIKELRKKVNKHFKDNKLSRYANLNMKLKTAFMLGLYFVPFILMVAGVVSSLWPVMLMWVIMSFGMSGIGLAIMHDANHGAYSKNQKVNNVLGFLINFLGSYHITWKIQHNVLHHSFTNVHDLDEDINNEVMRFSPNRKRKSMFRFQMLYALFFYGLLSLHKLISKDFQQLHRYHKKNLLVGQGLTLKQAVIQIIFNKISYLGLILILPMFIMQLPWWQVLLGFLSMHFICGLTLALIFQAAHVLNETNFYVANDNGSLENNWAIHQMKTTANFAKGGKIFSWLIGGLNHQIEHHLFPNICHVHYRSISGIVHETAKEFNVPYYQHKTFYGALKSHFSFLNQLGTGQYDKNLAKG